MKNMFKIYWIFDGNCYIFKFYLHEFLIVSGSYTVVKGGNKKKSGKISAPNIFMNTFLYNSTGKPYRKPELNLWEEYLESFWISERTLIRWIDEKIRDNEYHRESLKKLKNKIKDEPL